VSEVLRGTFSQSIGGNVLVFSIGSFISPDVAENLLRLQLSGMDGVAYNTVTTIYNGQVTEVDGEPVELVVPSFSRGDDGDGPSVGINTRDTFPFTVTSRESGNPNLNSGVLIEGRDLTPEDRGQRVMVVTQGLASTQISLYVGSIVTFEDEGRSYDFEIVGVTSQLTPTFGSAFIPPDSLDSASPNLRFNVLQVDEEYLNQALLSLSEMPFVISVDITFVDGLLSRLINQFAAIPTVVGLLSLLAAATIMANTVALATLERRRQIGILKAIGLKGRRVLWVMLLENSLIGILGGALGIGLSAIFMLIGTQLSTGLALAIPRDATVTVLTLFFVSILIAWVATFLSARVAIRERVLNVLRYE
jgi:ABC-type antimicrobial peptide transport system permease subunit